jgi:hypothetical protein
VRGIRVHSAEHARAALGAARACGQAATLISPPAAASLMGTGWWRELIAVARTEFPDVAFEAVLDCGPAVGLALAAIRCGAAPIMVAARSDVFGKIADIAEQAGTKAIAEGSEALDLLGMPDPGLACREWLAVKPAGAEDGGDMA